MKIAIHQEDRVKVTKKTGCLNFTESHFNKVSEFRRTRMDGQN